MILTSTQTSLTLLVCVLLCYGVRAHAVPWCVCVDFRFKSVCGSVSGVGWRGKIRELQNGVYCVDLVGSFLEREA